MAAVARERARRAEQMTAERLRSAQRQAATRSRQLATQAAQRGRSTGESVWKRATSFGGQALNSVREKSSPLFQKARMAGVAAASRVRAAAARFGEAGKDRVAMTYRRASSTFLKNVKQVKRNYGERGHALVDEFAARYGPRAAKFSARYLSTVRKGGVQALAKGRAIAATVGTRVRDPAVRQKAIHAAIVAGAVAFYVHQHKSDIEYRVLDYGLDHVQIPTRTGPKSLSAVYTDAVLGRAPYLEGTDLAEDPAALLAFGVGDVTRKDLLNHVDIIPDGRGGRHSIAEAVSANSSASEAMEALQVSESLEGIAFDADEHGKLGRHGESFVSTYHGMEKRFEQ